MSKSALPGMISAISFTPRARGVRILVVTEPIKTQVKDGVAWRVAGQADVDWVMDGTEPGRRITAAIPPMFAAYATLTDAGEPQMPRNLSLERRQDLAFVDVLRRHSRDMAWWIGYLDTGASDIVFWDAPKVTLYEGWHYVFVLAGPEQAATWRPARGGHPNWKSTELPEVSHATWRLGGVATARRSTRRADRDQPG
jgi:hypothetical protein